MAEDTMAAASSAIHNSEPMGLTEVSRSISLLLPATLNELEHFCEVLEQDGVAGITPVRPAPVDGHAVRLYVNVMENRGLPE